MVLPVRTNCTVDICRVGSTTPVLTGVAGHLRADFARGLTGVPTPVAGPPTTWTHILLVAADVDLRDAYIGCGTCATQDTVCIPDAAGTPYLVVFVERVDLGTPYDHKRVYLDRQAPPWPTNHL